MENGIKYGIKYVKEPISQCNVCFFVKNELICSLWTTQS